MLRWSRASCGFFPLTSQSASIYKLYQVHIILHIATLDGVEIESVGCIRDLGIEIDANLKFHSHTNSCVHKANRILFVIAKSFINLSSNMLPVLYKSLVRPVLEYGKHIWGPFYIHDQIQIEKVQKGLLDWLQLFVIFLTLIVCLR